MTNILSLAQNIHSLYQLIALAILASLLAFIAAIGYLIAKLACWLMSKYSKVNVSGNKGDSQIDVRLRR